MDVNPEVERCIHACLGCYQSCLSTAMNHCLEMGGEHAQKAHLTLMMTCAEICRTAAHLMLIRSAQQGDLCRECAGICHQCANDCERLGGMEVCVEACRKCATACEAMAA